MVNSTGLGCRFEAPHLPISPTNNQQPTTGSAPEGSAYDSWGSGSASDSESSAAPRTQPPTRRFLPARGGFAAESRQETFARPTGGSRRRQGLYRPPA